MQGCESVNVSRNMYLHCMKIQQPLCIAEYDIKTVVGFTTQNKAIVWSTYYHCVDTWVLPVQAGWTFGSYSLFAKSHHAIHDSGKEYEAWPEEYGKTLAHDDGWYRQSAGGKVNVQQIII